MADKIKTKRSTKTSTKKQQIVKLANKGNTEREIAQLTGLSKTTVHTELQALKHDPDYLKFTENKAEVFEQLQYKLVNLADHDTLKTMLNKRGFTDVAILNDKIQALRGQASSISLQDIRILIETRPNIGKVEGSEAVPLLAVPQPEVNNATPLVQDIHTLDISDS